jgi:hypothetical protein
MDNRLVALAECVDRGIEEGWWQARRTARQPTKDQWREAIYQAVMRRIQHCLHENQLQETAHEI